MKTTTQATTSQIKYKPLKQNELIYKTRRTDKQTDTQVKFITKNLKYAIGVFEGGGVKGAAYAGALKACEEGGITLIGACGTSAGSIAAALVAAGATTEEIRKALTTNFSTFITPNKRLFGFRKWLKKQLQKYELKGIEKAILKIRIWVSRIRFEKGISNSEEIQTWLNSVLCEILQIKQGTAVKFSDLRKPLAVLATDISNNQAKIWSTKGTPDDSVAFAVRCSCSIPLFFYPIENEDSSYVDGGAIANLPLFLTKKLDDIAFVPSICFQFEKSRTHSSIKKISISEFLYRIIGTTITSNTDMQLHLNEEWHNVIIDHCGIESTDFFLTDKKKNDLVSSGYNAVLNFIRSEKLTPQKNKSNTTNSTDTNRHYHLTETQRLIRDATKEICFFGGDLSWLKNLFISIAAAKIHRNISINILIDKEKFNEKETQKNIIFAKNLGITVKCSNDSIKIRGLVIDRNDNYGIGIFIEKSETPQHHRISKEEHPRFFNHINDLFDKNWKTEEETAPTAPIKIHEIAQNRIIESLKKIKQYRDSKISFEEINTNSLAPLSNNAEIFKLERVEDIKYLSEKANNSSTFHIVGTEWLFIPPIVEESSGKYIVIDGTHRCYLAAKEKKQTMRVILIKGCESHLPAKPGSSWKEIQVNTKKRDRKNNYFSYNEKDFRHIKTEIVKLANQINKEITFPPTVRNKNPHRAPARLEKRNDNKIKLI